MAANLRSGWTARSLTPTAGLRDSSLGSRAPSSTTGNAVATQSTFSPLQNSALFNLGQNQSNAFFQSLLGAMGGGGGGGGGGTAPRMDATQGNAINWLIQQIGAENWNRQRQQDLLDLHAPPVGMGGIGIMGGGVQQAVNPVMDQFLSSQRLAPSVALGTAAASFGGGFSNPMGMNSSGGGGRSGWTSPVW